MLTWEQARRYHPYPLIVTAAVIRRRDKVLVARRQQGHLSGKWEFPGGKLEPGESPEACLAREIKEELGLEVRVDEVFAVVYHRYETGPILLLAYECTLADGSWPETGLAPDAPAKWVSREELARLDLAPADVPIAEKLSRLLESNSNA
ncbi:MAG: (deoxy)nucleoside triphosphate pyrophosphohydrolase [Moorellales bacterium]